MEKFLVACLFGLLLVVPGTSAHALNITVNDFTNRYTYLSAGQSFTGQFDINSLFQHDAQYNTTYDIVSANLSFHFSDDNDRILDSSYLTSSYSQYMSYTNYIGGMSRYFQRTGVRNYSDEGEAAQVNVNGDIGTNATSYYSNYYENRWYDRAGYVPNYNYNYYYTTYNETTSGYSGSFSIEQNLSAFSLLDLSRDGILTYTVTAQTGDLYFHYGSLSAEINPNPVPEPSTIILLGGGLIGLCLYGRKRTK